MRALLLLIGISLGLSPPVRSAQFDWIPLAFPDRAHNFGNVARGSQVRYAFPVVNRSNYEIHIADWQTKCGCTNVKVGARAIPPGTQTTVEATIDTTRFHGRKDSGLTLVIDRPSYAEVTLDMTCFIRDDVTMTPGQFDFGTVRRAEKLPSVAITVNYAGGRPGWEIAEMKTQTSKVKAVARKADRPGGPVQWTVTATLQPSVTNGYLKDEVTLITNDSPPQTIPISVVANIQSAVSVAPAIINFGPVRAGQSVGKVVHVRSATPFALTKIEADRAEVKAVDSPPGSSSDHTVNLTLQAPAVVGPFHGVVKIESDLKDEPPGQIKVFATVVPGP